jgi:hypothetical protein
MNADKHSRTEEAQRSEAGGFAIRRRLNNLPHKEAKFVAVREEMDGE